MTATQLATFPPQIVAALGGRQPTAEQWRAISMPPEPCAVVAGAGSGKTSVMAARVVYLALVGLGAIDADHRGIVPGNVLCLTFTNKATENLALRVRERALDHRGSPRGGGAGGHELPRLRGADHRAARASRRLGAGDEGAHAGAAGGGRRARARPHDVSVGQGRVAAERRGRGPEAGGAGRQPSGVARGDRRLQRGAPRGAARFEGEGDRQGGGAADRARAGGPHLPGPEGGDGRVRLRRPDPNRARYRAAVPRGRRGLSSAIPRCAARRVSGHQRRAGPAHLAHVRRRIPHHGGRRPRPEHLRLARRQPVQPPAFSRSVPHVGRGPCPGASALHQLSVGLTDPGGGRPHPGPASGLAARRPRQASRSVGGQRERRRRARALLRRVDRGVLDRGPRGRAA